MTLERYSFWRTNPGGMSALSRFRIWTAAKDAAKSVAKARCAMTLPLLQAYLIPPHQNPIRSIRSTEEGQECLKYLVHRAFGEQKSWQ